MVSPVVMYRYESWTIKKAERQRIDAFELWWWRRLLIVPWASKISNQSILKEIHPEYSLERLMLKLKLHYFGHLIQRADSLEKILMLGKIESNRKRGWQRKRWLDSIIVSMDMKLSKLLEIVKEREDWRAAVHEVMKSQTWINDWTTTAELEGGSGSFAVTTSSCSLFVVIVVLPFTKTNTFFFSDKEECPFKYWLMNGSLDLPSMRLTICYLTQAPTHSSMAVLQLDVA